VGPPGAVVPSSEPSPQPRDEARDDPGDDERFLRERPPHHEPRD
jgi:hypothetical protein